MIDNKEKMKSVEQYLGKRIDRVIGTLNHQHVNSLSTNELREVFDNLFSGYKKRASHSEKYGPEMDKFETTTEVGEGLSVKGSRVKLASIRTLLYNIAALENTAIMFGEIFSKEDEEQIVLASECIFKAMFHLEETIMKPHYTGNVIKLHPVAWRVTDDTEDGM